MSSLISRNEGMIDRVFRVVFGLVLLSLVVIGPHTAWGYLGIIPLLTGLVGTCPMYSILGMNTCGVKRG